MVLMFCRYERESLAGLRTEAMAERRRGVIAAGTLAELGGHTTLEGKTIYEHD